MTLAITHTHAAGTVLDSDPRPHQQILKDAGWRYSRNVGWYVRRSRDAAPQTAMIERVADQLRDVGFEVLVEISTERRTVAEIEADRAERADARADRLDQRSARHLAAGEAKVEQAREMADQIPLGQPILTDHYSARRDRNYRDRIGRKFETGFRQIDEGREMGRRADVARDQQERRESAPVTLRRIRKLEADRAVIVRNLERPHQQTGDRETDERHQRWVEGQIDRLGEIDEQLTYWREHLAQLEADGVKLWGPDDFKKGDRVQTGGGGATVVRVNKKSLSCTWDVMPEITRTCTYDKIRGKL